MFSIFKGKVFKKIIPAYFLIPILIYICKYQERYKIAVLHKPYTQFRDISIFELTFTKRMRKSFG